MLRFVLIVIAPFIVCSMIENSGSGHRSIVDNNDEESPYFVEESRNSLLTIPNVYRPPIVDERITNMCHVLSRNK